MSKINKKLFLSFAFGLASDIALFIPRSTYQKFPHGDFIRDYFASFAGAYCAIPAMEFILEKLYKSPEKKNLRLHAIFASAVILTGTEVLSRQLKRPGYSGNMDWGDMAAYAAAMLLYCSVNKGHTNFKLFADDPAQDQKLETN